MHRLSLILLFAAVVALSSEAQVPKDKGNDKPTPEKTQQTFVKRYPLPFSDEILKQEAATSETILLNERKDIEQQLTIAKSDTLPGPEDFRRIKALEQKLCMNSERLALLQYESICGGHDESQPVESYNGALGVSKELVNRTSPCIGQIQWKYSFGDRFRRPGAGEGDVKGDRWCSGTLIGPDLFITAGHCFDSAPNGRRLPYINGRIISREEAIKLMRVNFNYQYSATSGLLRSDTIAYPIIAIREYRKGGLDYAIISLGPDTEGRLPGNRFGYMKLLPVEPGATAISCAVIQHPQGEPKKIEAGPVVSDGTGMLLYYDIDTQGGSSGSPVIAAADEKIIGIHIEGGCNYNRTRPNKAVSVKAIQRVSSILQKLLR